MTLEELRVIIDAETSGLRQELRGVQSQFRGLNGYVDNATRGINKALSGVKIAIASLGIGKLIKDSMGAAMGVETSIQQINRSMNVHSREFLAWANTQAAAFGMAEGEAYKYGAVYSNLISSFEGDTKKVTEYTTNLLKSSAIVASGTGRSMEDTMDRIRSGLLGNTESIEDLGINVNIAMIESTEAFKRFANGKSWQQLDFKTQQQIRLFAIMEQASKKYGDSLNQNTASAQQQFTAQLKNIQANLGEAFLPIYKTILPALTSFAAQVAETMEVVGQFMIVLFGTKQATASGGNATKESTKANTKLAQSYTDAGKAAKKAQGFLASFDEVNTINDSGSDAGATGTDAGASSVINPVDNSDKAGQEPEAEVNKKLQEMADNLKAMFEPITTSFEKLKKSIQPVVDTVSTGLKWGYDNVLVPFGKWTISAAIPAFFDLLSGALAVLNPLLQSLQPLGGWLWDNFLKPMASFVANAFVNTLKTVGDSLKTIGDWMSNNKSVVEGITISVASFIATWEIIKLLSFIQTSGGVIGALKSISTALFGATAARIADNLATDKSIILNAVGLVKSIASSTVALVKNTGAWVSSTVAKYADEAALAGVSLTTVVWNTLMSTTLVTMVKSVAQWVAHTASIVASTVAQTALTVATAAWNVICGIGTALTTAFGVAMAILTSPITLVIAAIAALVAGVYLLIKHWDDVKLAAEGCWNKIVDVWNVCSTWFSDNIITPVSNFFKGLWDGIANKASGAWTGIKNVWATVAGWFNDNVIKPITTAFKTVWNGISDGFTVAFDLIKKGIKSYINGYISVVEGFVNGVIKGVNFIIRALNKIDFDVPDWVPIIGGNTFGFNLPSVNEIKIPQLARGGIIDSPTLAMIGERGKEAVVPLENTSFVNTLASALGSAVMSAMQFSGREQPNQQTTLILKIGEREFGRLAINSINNAQRQAGVSLLLV